MTCNHASECPPRGVNPSSEFAFFAYPAILGEIRRYFRDQLTIIRMPRALQDLHAETVALREEVRQRTGREATDAELASAAGVAVEQIRAEKTAWARCRVANLYAPEVYGVVSNYMNPDAAVDLSEVEAT